MRTVVWSAVIVAAPSPAALAAAAAALTTPIVLANGDPLTFGLVTSLARPGGMITGLSNVTADLNQKVFELLVESVPKLQRVGLWADSSSPNLGAFVTSARRAAEHFRVEAVVADVARPQDIEPAMARLVKAKVQGVVILSSTWMAIHYPNIVNLALAQRWPVVGSLSAIPRFGGLFSYGPDRVALYRRSAYYVDRILKGAKPGDLPIEQPTVFELVINLKTAKALGITIPPSMRIRATEVIE
jgi:putative tryptophan/tyrosine transport system substrate-binding protein